MCIHNIKIKTKRRLNIPTETLHCQSKLYLSKEDSISQLKPYTARLNYTFQDKATMPKRIYLETESQNRCIIRHPSKAIDPSILGLEFDPSILGLKLDPSILGLTKEKIPKETMEIHNQGRVEDEGQDLKSQTEELKRTRN